MMFALMIVCVLASFAASLWAIYIIFKRSLVGALLSLFLGIPILYYLVKGWGKEGEDIRKPFFASIILYAIAGALGVSMVTDSEELKKMQASEPPARTAPKASVATKQPEAPKAAEAPKPADAPKPAEVVSVKAPPVPAPSPVAAPAPAPSPRAAAPRPAPQRVEPVREAPRAQQAAPTCVYKAVMTDEDMARCR